ncbi:MAG: MGMT family protein [bacterium]
MGNTETGIIPGGAKQRLHRRLREVLMSMDGNRNEGSSGVITTFQQRAINVIKKIPRGKVATYGQIAVMAGDSRGARQVVRVLHNSSTKEKLPWHRVINRQGRISLRPGSGYEQQRAMLEDEGISFNRNGTIDLRRYQWSGG